jgi:hypothetical protein
MPCNPEEAVSFSKSYLFRQGQPRIPSYPITFVNKESSLEHQKIPIHQLITFQAVFQVFSRKIAVCG